MNPVRRLNARDLLPTVRRAVARGLYESMTLGARFPAIVLPAARLRGHGVVVDPATDLLVEGYPRSGNSFAVAGIATAQPEPLRIAHHLHAPAHVLAACEMGVPALVVVRDPAEAVVEFALIKPDLTLAQALRGYRRFYAPLLRHRRRFVVATFGEVTADLGRVVRRVNERFATSFTAFTHSEQQEAETQRAIQAQWSQRRGPGLPVLGRTPEPVEGDEADALRGRLRASYAGPRLARSRGRAERLYAAFERMGR